MMEMKKRKTWSNDRDLTGDGNMLSLDDLIVELTSKQQTNIFFISIAISQMLYRAKLFKLMITVAWRMIQFRLQDFRTQWEITHPINKIVTKVDQREARKALKNSQILKLLTLDRDV